MSPGEVQRAIDLSTNEFKRHRPLSSSGNRSSIEFAIFQLGLAPAENLVALTNGFGPDLGRGSMAFETLEPLGSDFG